eukprot:GFUD01009037.1.p1 GENE.GFUD01009037.1~~GFUD01009037.1.p1  ORF type:complete len:657 (+),score=126.71 GFUD01009037.1:144-2114(+)
MTEATTSCGLFSWRPEWLQKLATKQVYAAVYSILGIVQGMGFSYLTSVLSTIEKQFGIKSKETAWIFSGNEISQIFFIFALPFLGIIRKRALWTSISMVGTSIGLFLCASPYLVKDKSLYDGGWNIKNSGNICGEHSTRDVEECSTKAVRDFWGMVIIFVGFFITGIGSSFFYSFGIPYIDDNVSKDSSPAVLGIVLGSRTLSPSLGYLLGSFCLSIYVSPGREDGLAEGDDGWLGAWWLGFVIVASLTGLISPFLALFPERLPSEDKTTAKTLEQSKTEISKTGMDYIRDTRMCAVRLMKNKIYVFQLLYGVTALLAMTGLGTFMPKYFEFHFRQKATRSGLSSIGSSIFTGLGFIISGQAIGKFKLKAKTVAAWNMFIGFFAVLTLVAVSFIACPKLQVYGSSETAQDCHKDCGCSISEFQPTCSKDGVTLFFSPCHAGCKTVTTEQVDGKDIKVFEDCSCVSQAAAEMNSTVTEIWWRKEELQPPSVVGQSGISGAVEGFCPSNCDNLFYLTIVIAGLMFLLASTGAVGGILISLRAVEPQDKSASLVINISFLSLFAFFPSPIIFGAIMDNACSIWGSSCGEQTNCQLYDTDAMRNYMCWFTAACLFVSFLCDIGMWRCVGDLQLYEEHNAEGKVELQEMKTGHINKGLESD